jgi:pimeloyl-ACP methyl ester carboxylesterase
MSAMPEVWLDADREVMTSKGPIRYRDVGEGRPLLFTHLVLGNGAVWRKVVPVLSGRFRCIVPDWPMGGHVAPMAADADLSPAGLASLMVEFLDELGLDRVTLIGNDTGGALCQVVAATYPERVEAMILTNCDAYENFLPRRFRYLQVLGRWPSALWLVGRVARIRLLWPLPISFGGVMKTTPDPAVIQSYTRGLLADPAVRRDAAKVLRGISPRYTLEAVERLRHFEQPVLLAWAPDDRPFPIRYAERLLADLPNARLERIEDSLTLVGEDQPQRTAELIAQFAAA